MTYACQRCNQPRVKGSRFCARHSKSRVYRPPETKPRQRTARSTTVKRSPHWHRVRKVFLGQHPLCARCMTVHGVSVQAEVVDHVRPVRDRPDLELTDSNLQSLCVSCHSKKTLDETHRKIAKDYLRRKQYKCT